MSQTFQCCLCQENLVVKQTKKGKPYLICEDCGMQMFVRYRRGIHRLDELCERQATLLEGYVLCRDCEVAVRKVRRKIENPLFGEAGLYCPSCGNLLKEAPEDW